MATNAEYLQQDCCQAGCLLQVHFAEEWNEIHHLMIMESLGGDQLWVDRFMAQHAAVFYFWVLVIFFAVSPSLAYVFSEMVEVRLECQMAHSIVSSSSCSKLPHLAITITPFGGRARIQLAPISSV